MEKLKNFDVGTVRHNFEEGYENETIEFLADQIHKIIDHLEPVELPKEEMIGVLDNIKEYNPKTTEKFANCRGAKLIEVIAVEVNEGKGNSEDPIRRVLYLYSKEGKLLAHSKDDFERKFTEKDFMILDEN